MLNSFMVKAEEAPADELETMWEIAGWTWNWMEPVMGVGCFVVLCLQVGAVVRGGRAQPGVRRGVVERLFPLSRTHSSSCIISVWSTSTKCLVSIPFRVHTMANYRFARRPTGAA